MKENEVKNKKKTQCKILKRNTVQNIHKENMKKEIKQRALILR